MTKDIQSHAPSAQLRSNVRSYAQRSADAGDVARRQRATARLEPTLEFQFQGTVGVRHADGRFHYRGEPRVLIVGGYAQPVEVLVARKMCSFAVIFQPTGFSRLFGTPVRELFGQSLDAAAVIGRQVEALCRQLADAPDFERRVSIVDAFLARQLARNVVPAESLWRVADRMFAEKGALRMDQAAAVRGLGVRQFERQFCEQIGTTPKLYSRIARFQFALDAKTTSQDRSWMCIAHELGYHDQMHMVRDFYDLAGCAPGTLLAKGAAECLPAEFVEGSTERPLTHRSVILQGSAAMEAQSAVEHPRARIAA